MDVFDDTIPALDGITEGTGLNVKPTAEILNKQSEDVKSFDERLDEIISNIQLAAVGYSDGEPNVLTTQAVLYKQPIQALISAQNLALLTRLEAKAGWYSQLLTDKARRDPSVEDTLIPLTAIQSERALIAKRMM